MREVTYTAQGLERMRAAIRYTLGLDSAYHNYWGQHPELAMLAEYQRVEEMIRTYVIAGVNVTDVEAIADRHSYQSLPLAYNGPCESINKDAYKWQVKRGLRKPEVTDAAT